MKKKVKKVASIFFALCLSACLLTACGGNDKTAESSSETKAETTVSAKDKEDDSKKEESETEKESETDAKKKDETKETGKTADNQKETSNSSSGSSASKTTSSNKNQNSGSNNSASQSSQPSEPVHTHTWVWATHTETIPEQSHVVEVKKYVCNNCGQQFDNVDDAGRHCVADFWDNCENYTYKVVDSQTVIDVPAQTVTVNDYEYCSECGARK